MKARGFGFETAAPAADTTPDRRHERDPRAPMRAAPPDSDDPARDKDGPRGDEPTDEPGYGHGV